MTIISAKDHDGNDLSQEQIEADFPQLVEDHQTALAKEPTWSVFGGMLTVNGHEYQVS